MVLADPFRLMVFLCFTAWDGILAVVLLLSRGQAQQDPPKESIRSGVDVAGLCECRGGPQETSSVTFKPGGQRTPQLRYFRLID